VLTVTDLSHTPTVAPAEKTAAMGQLSLTFNDGHESEMHVPMVVARLILIYDMMENP
jgi:hypothetical protein